MLIYVNTYHCPLGMCAAASVCTGDGKRKRGSLDPSIPFCFYQIVQVTPLVRELLQPFGIVIVQAERHHLL